MPRPEGDVSSFLLREEAALPAAEVRAALAAVLPAAEISSAASEAARVGSDSQSAWDILLPKRGKIITRRMT